MPSSDTPGPAGPAVLGAGGRVGSAVVNALLRRGHDVTAIVRNPSRHTLPDAPGLRIRQGDAQRPDLLSETLRGAGAVVLAVTPFSGPPQTFDGFDRDYYATIVSGLDRAMTGRRLVCVGLTATARLDDGTRFLDHPDRFPPFLAPFADAHLRATAALRDTTLDWATLIPPAGFGTLPPAGRPAASGYRLRREPVTLADATSALDHATFAEAVADEIASPTVHRERALVTSGHTAETAGRPG
ncbi:NAD(P)-dependent oxidoreductase [Streptomyces hoynatensis]|uniref:NAD-dependent epimerase/dehydratase family protein n=1 Tax=Streptomyces hoynatensis TaxID=1141874 RepID=A0A3A9ZCH9_9ACTN|nr:NAD(P)H-binding protein [Streptomyces hoynatensis]RKN45564.1 NAD-dependent epimerase/dehydratase family protein [Streptomyces hoynatensis]